MNSKNIIINIEWRNFYHIRFHYIISKSFDVIGKEKIGYDFDSYIACVTLYKMGAVPMANREKCLVELSAVMTCITSWQVGKISKKKFIFSDLDINNRGQEFISSNIKRKQEKSEEFLYDQRFMRTIKIPKLEKNDDDVKKKYIYI